MLHLHKPDNITKSPMTLYDAGLNILKSKQIEQKVATEDILFHLKRTTQINNPSFMLESLLKNKRMSYKTKLTSSKNNSQTTSLSRILDLDSIQKEKVLIPFWTNSLLEMSKKLWLPLKTDSQGSTLNFFKTFFNDSTPNLLVYPQKNINLLMKNYQKTLCQSSPSSQPATMEKEVILKTRRIRIYPTKKQKEYYNKCFGTTRFIYNKIVDFVKHNSKIVHETLKKQAEKGCCHFNKKTQKYCNQTIVDKTYFCKKHSGTKIDYGFALNIGSLRKKSGLFTKEFIKKNSWLENIPYDTRQLVINDFIAGYKAAITNFKNGNIDSFEMGYKSQKQLTQFFHIDKRAIKKEITIFKRKKLGKTRVRNKMKRWYKKNINDNITNNSKIIRYKPGKYYLLLTIESSPVDKISNYECVSLDPGVRTFQTFYSPDGIVGKIGDGFVEKNLLKHATRIDKINSILSKLKNKKRTRKNLKNRQFLLRTKIKNSVMDLHWKTANFLCRNFETIIIPKFGCKEMSNKNSSIHSKITRRMLLLSHGMFLEKLKFKCKEYKRKLILVNESFTSKTCTKCGNLKNDLGSSKVYNCKNCGISIDRDHNGARNILLKTIKTIYNRQ